MESTYQVILLLKLLLLVGPLAVYFMVLGLLNSQPAARLMDARRDFAVLTLAVCPVLLVPATALWQQGHGWLLVPGFAVVALVMRALLPGPNSGWVVYNLSVHRARVLLERCLRELGWQYEVVDGVHRLEEQGLEIQLSSLPVLRNVTYHLRYADEADRTAVSRSLGERLGAALARQQLLPSLAGSCLMMLGVGLMVLPLWMMSRHSDAIAEVVTRLLIS